MPKEDKAIALETLRNVCEDSTAPAAARAAAARTLLEQLGEIGRLQTLGKDEEDRPLVEMNRRELDDEITRLRARLRELPAPEPLRRKRRTKLEVLAEKREDLERQEKSLAARRAKRKRARSRPPRAPVQPGQPVQPVPGLDPIAAMEQDIAESLAQGD